MSESITIKDIARLANVSQATVSKALNDRPDVGLETKEHILKIAEQHNFPVDFPEPETAVSILTMLLSRDDLYSVIAEGDGVIVG